MFGTRTNVSFVLVMCEKVLVLVSELRFCEGKESVLMTLEVIYLYLHQR